MENKNILTAKEFLKTIQKEQNKYKLVNGLFIVKYINNDICFYVGDFLKAKEPLNNSKTNKVKLIFREQPQLFNTKYHLTQTNKNQGFKKLEIGFKEEDIIKILD